MLERELSQAGFIVGKLGGLSSASRLLGHKSASTVQGWVKRGYIPPARQPEVLEKAIRAGVDLTSADFVQHLTALEVRLRTECSGVTAPAAQAA